MRIETGIEQVGTKYSVSIELPARKGHNERSHSFHLGTVKTLEDAKDVRRKAVEIREEYKGYIDDCVYYLQKLKEQIRDRRVTRKDAIDILRDMLYEHRCNSAWIDFNSDDDDEIEKATEWTKRDEALKVAIKCLNRQKKGA